MGRFWSFLFLMVPVLGVWMIVAPAMDAWPFNGGWLAFPVGEWLPENINPQGRVIDTLFLFLFYVTGAIFVGTGWTLFWFLWKYDAAQNPEPVKFLHGSHTLEVVWSVLPATTLLFIAVYQMNAWADQKMRRPQILVDGKLVAKPPLALVTGRQFEWAIRYAGDDGQLFTPDDIHVVNDLHVPVDEEIVLQIESQDVLHSFFLPNLRIKQDVVPGMTQFVWFLANKPGTYDIVCAELCGWGHYKMRGRLTVESRARFERWLAETYREQERASYSADEGEP